jgi:hypothetical protein
VNEGEEELLGPGENSLWCCLAGFVPGGGACGGAFAEEGNIEKIVRSQVSV